MTADRDATTPPQTAAAVTEVIAQAINGRVSSWDWSPDTDHAAVLDMRAQARRIIAALAAAGFAVTRKTP